MDKFIHGLNLESVEPVYSKCSEICDWVGELEWNKKEFINKQLNSIFDGHDGKHLLLIPAAGKNPLALEILQENFNKIDRIIEIDSFGMDENQERYYNYNPTLAGKIKCITADINDEKTFHVLNSLLREYYSNHPTITIVENSSLFITDDKLRTFLINLSTVNHENTIIIEFLLETAVISENMRNISERIYSTICSECGVDTLTRYTQKSIGKIFSECGAERLKSAKMKELEYIRSGENTRFKSDNDSWIDIEVWKI